MNEHWAAFILLLSNKTFRRGKKVVLLHTVSQLHIFQHLVTPTLSSIAVDGYNICCLLINRIPLMRLVCHTTFSPLHLLKVSALGCHFDFSAFDKKRSNRFFVVSATEPKMLNVMEKKNDNIGDLGTIALAAVGLASSFDPLGRRNG